MNTSLTRPAHPPVGANFASTTSMLALAATITVLSMVGIFIALGIGQDPLQYMHSTSEYTSILLKNPPALRAAIGLDNLFIVLYSSMFLTMGLTMWNRVESNALLSVALALMAASGLLDLLENMHFLGMLSAAMQGLEISATHVELQVWESLVKFHISYLGLFLLGYALPKNTMIDRSLCFTLRWIQLPIGLLIYLIPPDTARLLVFGRFTFFVVSLMLVWAAFRQQQYGSNAPA